MGLSWLEFKIKQKDKVTFLIKNTKRKYKNMLGINEIQIKVYCIRQDHNVEIRVDDEILDDFDMWLNRNSDFYFKEWCKEHDYNMNDKNWDDIYDQVYDEFIDCAYDYLFDELWEDFSDECILDDRTIDCKLW